jgi:hypothetical protein
MDCPRRDNLGHTPNHSHWLWTVGRESLASVRFIRMRKQIHDRNTAVNGSVMQWYSVWSKWSGSRRVRCYAIQNIWGAHPFSLLITLHISHSIFDSINVLDRRNHWPVPQPPGRRNLTRYAIPLFYCHLECHESLKKGYPITSTARRCRIHVYLLPIVPIAALSKRK